MKYFSHRATYFYSYNTCRWLYASKGLYRLIFTHIIHVDGYMQVRAYIGLFNTYVNSLGSNLRV